MADDNRAFRPTFWAWPRAGAGRDRGPATKAAAAEMKERFGALTEHRYGRVGFGTFHAVFFQILKLAYRYQASDIIREEERTALMRELVDREGMELEDEAEFIASVLGEIGSVKGEMLSLEHYYAKNCMCSPKNFLR